MSIEQKQDQIDKKGLSRRSFLKLAGIATAGLAVGLRHEKAEAQESTLHLDAIEVADLNPSGTPAYHRVDKGLVLEDPIFSQVKESITLAENLTSDFILKSPDTRLKAITNVTAVVIGKKVEEGTQPTKVPEVTVTPSAPRKDQKYVPVFITAEGYGFFVDTQNSKVWYYDNSEVLKAVGTGDVPPNFYIFPREDNTLVVADWKTGKKYAKGVPGENGKVEWTKAPIVQNTIDLENYNGTPWDKEYGVKLNSKVTVNSDAHSIKGTITVDNKRYEIKSDGFRDETNKDEWKYKNKDVISIRKMATLVGILGTRMVTGEPIPSVPEQIEVIDVMFVSKNSKGNLIKQIFSIPLDNGKTDYWGGPGDRVPTREKLLEMLAPGRKILPSFLLSRTSWDDLSPLMIDAAIKSTKQSDKVQVSLMAATDIYRENILSLGTNSERNNCYLRVSNTTKIVS